MKKQESTTQNKLQNLSVCNGGCEKHPYADTSVRDPPWSGSIKPPKLHPRSYIDLGTDGFKINKGTVIDVYGRNWKISLDISLSQTIKQAEILNKFLRQRMFINVKKLGKTDSVLS